MVAFLKAKMTKPLKPNPKLLKLWRSMTPAERKVFATLAKSTDGSLRQAAEGRRGISADLASRIERAAVKIGAKPISRMELNETCAKCEFARYCKKVSLA